MEIKYSDQQITELINETKTLPDDWRDIIYKKGKLDIEGDNGNTFRIIARQHKSVPLDFSVILAIVTPAGQVFRLRRYNGWTNPHTNRIEKNEVDGFHIHFATERYQRRGQREDAYAEETSRYNDFEGAVRCLIEDANFQEPLQSQSRLF